MVVTIRSERWAANVQTKVHRITTCSFVPRTDGRTHTRHIERRAFVKISETEEDENSITLKKAAE